MPKNVFQNWSKLLLKFYSKVVQKNLDLKISAQAMALKFGLVL